MNPGGSTTTYRFEYLDEGSLEANLAAGRDPFAGAALAPAGGPGLVGAGSTPVAVGQHLTNLAPDTAYRYRLLVVNAKGETAFGAVHPFGTETASNVFELLDHRGWELVSPVDKRGGAIQGPGAIFGGGVFQAAAGGGAMTYSSLDAFAGAQGSPTGSQYLSVLGAGGWSTGNISTPLVSGSYGDEPDGVPYRLFSTDLATALLSGGERCRGDAGGECPVVNPPLPGSGAPPGYRDYYRRSATGGFESLLKASDLTHTSLGPTQFELQLAGATPDQAHVVVSSCAALAADAIEVAAPGGCDPTAQNLYVWSGAGLSAVNLLPGEPTATPGASLAAPAGAISADGSRIYFAHGEGLYLREGGTTKLVDESPTGPKFEAASTDGAVAYVLDEGILYRYLAATGTLTGLTAGGAVEGVLGLTPDGRRVFYAEPGGLYMGEGATRTKIAAGASVANWPPATGAARVSADGRYLLFLSTEELTGYPSEGDPEVFLYGPFGSVTAAVRCVSCDPSGERPAGGASVPGAIANGTFAAYKPRVLAADGSRVFFDSEDSLVPQDTNGRLDVYEWEMSGGGTCVRPGGCLQLISTGRSAQASTFLDASVDGADAFFLTSESIYPIDPGSYDVYDARVGGGFTLPSAPVTCEGDACQVLPSAPEDPTPATLTPNPGNPPLATKNAKPKKHKKKHKQKRRHKKNRKHGKKGSKAGKHKQKHRRKGRKGRGRKGGR